MNVVLISLLVFVLSKIWSKTPFIDLFLAELLAYRSAGAPVPLTAASKERERGLSKGARKQAKLQQAEQLNGTLSTLISWPLRVGDAQALTLADGFNNMGSFGIILLLMYSIQSVSALVMPQRDLLTLPCLALVAVAFTLYTLATAELFTECTSWSDKYHIMAFFAGGSLLFMSLMILPAHSIIDFRLEQACLDLNTAVNGIVESVVAAKLRITPPTVHLDATYVAAVLSVLAGCLCAMLWSPASLFSTLLFHVNNTPLWSHKSGTMNYTRGARRATQAALLLPLTVALLPLRPMTDAVLGLALDRFGERGVLTMGTLQAALPLLLLALAFAHFAVLRTLNQAHLDAALVKWHTLRATLPPTPALAHALQIHLVFNRARLGKVCTQLSALPCLALCFTVLLLCSGAAAPAWTALASNAATHLPRLSSSLHLDAYLLSHTSPLVSFLHRVADGSLHSSSGSSGSGHCSAAEHVGAGATTAPPNFEWYRSYTSLEPLLQLHLSTSTPVLHVGFGTSTMQVDMADAGWRRILNVDYSQVAVTRMAALHARYSSRSSTSSSSSSSSTSIDDGGSSSSSRSSSSSSSSDSSSSSMNRSGVREELERGILEYGFADVRSMPELKTGSFGSVLDKGCLCALLCGDSEEADAAAMLSEVHRLLSPGGGVYFYVTYAPPSSRLQYLLQQGMDWGDQLQLYEVGQQQQLDGPYDLPTASPAAAAAALALLPHTLPRLKASHFVYVLTKGGQGQTAAA
ncbi:MAG: hypothetical protein WDW36_006587 [Sanguina aurantia]